MITKVIILVPKCYIVIVLAFYIYLNEIHNNSGGGEAPSRIYRYPYAGNTFKIVMT